MLKLLAMLFVAMAGAALAAEPPRARPMGPRAGGGAMMRFDASKIETVEGTIEQVLTMQGGRGMQGVHLRLKTAKEMIDVPLGPGWFVDKQATRLQAGDSVSVRGSRSVVRGQPALIAVDVKRGGDTLRLREDDGTPLWARGCGPNCPDAGL